MNVFSAGYLAHQTLGWRVVNNAARQLTMIEARDKFCYVILRKGEVG